MSTALFRSVEMNDALDKRTDAEVADLILCHVWTEFDVASPQSSLMTQAIERLRRSAELLAALREAVKFIEDDTCRHDAEKVEVLMQIDAAIAKAEGRS